MDIVTALALCVAATASYWAWRAGEPAREILRIRAEREAAKAARHPSPPLADLRILPATTRPVPPDPFRDPPRSVRAFPGMHARYVRQPTSSLDWMGASWSSPTSLDFEQSTVTATRCGARTVYVHETPVHPRQIIHDLEVMWHRLRQEIHRAGVVVDADQVIGVTVGSDMACDQGDLMVRVKCWPSIEGVTVPRKDRTL